MKDRLKKMKTAANQTAQKSSKVLRIVIQILILCVLGYLMLYFYKSSYLPYVIGVFVLGILHSFFSYFFKINFKAFIVSTGVLLLLVGIVYIGVYDEFHVVGACSPEVRVVERGEDFFAIQHYRCTMDSCSWHTTFQGSRKVIKPLCDQAKR